MTIEEILDEMETTLLNAARVPFTNKRVIEEDDLAKLIDELREILPSEVMEANRVVSERRFIIEEAQKEAHNIVEQAKTYITKMTDENIITKQAQEQASEIINQAQKTARDLQYDALSYADDVFKHVENNLEKTLEVIRQGHKDLHQQSKG